MEIIQNEKLKAMDIIRGLKGKTVTVGMLLVLEKLKRGDKLVVFTSNERRTYRKRGHNDFVEVIAPCIPVSPDRFLRHYASDGGIEKRMKRVD